MKRKTEKRLQVYWTAEQGRVYRNGNSVISARESRERMARREYTGAEVAWHGVVPVNIFIEMQDEARDWRNRMSRGCQNTVAERCDEKSCPMYCEQ